MPRPVRLHQLTPEQILALPTPKRTTLTSDGGGLNIQTNPSGGRSWLFRYRYDGRERVMGFGPVRLDNLVEDLARARQLAADARRLLSEGIDPLDHRRQQRAMEAPGRPVTFRECANAYISVNEPTWRHPKHRQQWKNTLATYVHPVIGDLPVATIDVEHVKQILSPIWRAKPETAKRVRGRIQLILDYATAHRYRSGDNPARVEIVRQLLGKLSRRERSHAAVPWRSLPTLYGWLSERDDVASCALRWLVLTGARSAEARGTMWSEIRGDVWTIPEHRMKARRAHRVPLSTEAAAILDHMKTRRSCDYVFSADGKRPISDTSLRNLLRQMGVTREGGTLHGFRSSFRDWAAENGVPDRIAEAALAHSIGDKTEAAYLRTRYFDQRRAVMQRWADFLNGDSPDGPKTK